MNETQAVDHLLDAGDVAGALRELRGIEGLAVSELARLVGRAATLAGFDDLAGASAAVAHGPAGGEPQSLYDFGYACVERGIGDLAIEPLTRALELAPDAGPILSELVVVLGGAGRHARAVEVLEAHESIMGWPHRYQHVYNAIMAGDLSTAQSSFALLPEPSDVTWHDAREKVRRMLARAGAVRTVTSLDRRDLRGWHYVLTGGVLETYSPYGYDQGMTGRWAYMSDSANGCAQALSRVGLILDAAGIEIRSVSALPDRSSRILAAAAAARFALPLADFDAGSPSPNTLVVAYDLNGTDPEACAALRERAPGQVLFERATCWTNPPQVCADISGLLGQMVIAPWAPQLRALDDGGVGETPADDRPAEVIGAEIATAGPDLDDGDGETPPDPDDVLRRFVQVVTGPEARQLDGEWRGGVREYVSEAGPVPSSRFL